MSDNSSMQTHKPTGSMATRRSKVMLFLKGVAMGLGDSVPGISGGTIAVITKIYDQLVFSIRAVDLRACGLFFTGQFKAFWQHINGTFLLILALGILCGLLISANTVLSLLENYFVPLMAFFIGMVLASSALLRNEFSLRTWQNILALFLGFLLAMSIGFITPRSAELSHIYVFFSGAIAISAMILPGLSGAFILLLLGVYEFILGALLGFDLPYILAFMLGCGVGLLAFSRVLSWLLRAHHELSYGFITGMLLGSISALWPWQQAQAEAGEGYTMLLPALVCLVLGVVVVVLLQVVFATKPSESSN
jgi:putative membrane protein